MTDEEFGEVQQTAETAGLALGAWIGETIARSVGRQEWTLGASRAEVVRQLVRVRLDVAFAREVAIELGSEVGSAAIMHPLDAVLGRLDELIDRAVDDDAV